MKSIRSEARNVAEALHDAVGTSASPVNFVPLIKWIEENLNMHINLIASNTYLDDGGLSGKIYRTDDQAWILLNNNEPVTRQRFTLGHELGHLMETIPSQVAHMSKIMPTGYDGERFANAFASEYLMPADLLKQEWEKLSTFYPIALVQYKLAQLFYVSNETMGYRLNELGLQSSHWTGTSVPPVYSE